MEWSFSVIADGLTIDSDEHVPTVVKAIHAALLDWMGGTPLNRLRSDGEALQKGSSWVFPFKITLVHPEDELQDVRVDAVSLLCLNHNEGLCHDGPVNFQAVLDKHCTDAPCGDLKASDLSVNLTVTDHLHFKVAFSPLPRRLIDDVGRFLQTTMESWALRIGPKLKTPVAETADLAEDLVEVKNARIERIQSSDNSGIGLTVGEARLSHLALVVDLSVGLLAPTSSVPVKERILQEFPKDRDWVVDIMGLAAEEEDHLGDIGLTVTAMK